jgi:phosphohistidine phosphatase
LTCMVGEAEMRLYLVQHGEAKAKELDPHRHLTEKGVRDTEKVAAFLKPLGLNVSVVWHSGKARAAQTAELLATALHPAQGVIQRDGLAPNDPIGPVAGAVRSADEDLMIVGHLPFLGKLASELVAGSEESDVVVFQNSGVVCLEPRGNGNYRVRWIVTPELLG